MRIQSSAPSNIALIKYMGKLDPAQNKPTNRSLSLTLEHLRTYVELQQNAQANEDVWGPLEKKGLVAIDLSENGQRRFLKHFQFLKETFGIKGHFLVRSANNFPADCGIASSASSFAALTMAAYDLALNSELIQEMSLEQLAVLSQKGSGSSCRSFFSPWGLWDLDGAKEILLEVPRLHHALILAEPTKKHVSSSEAHRRVSTSELFAGRPERAELRLMELIHSLNSNQWAKACEITWAEFWDMHALFETAKPPFGYMTAGSLEVLNVLRPHISDLMVTMDAGANVHVIYRETDLTKASEVLKVIEKSFQVVRSGKSLAGGSREL